jgi:hypothetical protein
MHLLWLKMYAPAVEQNDDASLVDVEALTDALAEEPTLVDVPMPGKRGASRELAGTPSSREARS